MRIGVFDDEDTVAEVYAAFLELAGYEVVRGSSPQDVQAALDLGSVDAILTDLLHGLGNGPEIVRVIRSHPAGRRIPLVFMTASCDPEIQRQSLEWGADRFVRKPIEIQPLLDAFAALFHGPRA